MDLQCHSAMSEDTIMSEAELLEVANANTANLIAVFGTFISLATAYLVVAYLVGKKLTTSQLVIINALFIVLMVIMMNFNQMLSIESRIFYEEAIRIGSATSMAPEGGTLIIYLSRVVEFLIVVACLKFMWDSRHS